MSDIHNIQDLLEKYWEGETTLEEERRIKGYFASGDVDERLRKYAPMFQAFKEEQAVQWEKKAAVVPMRPQMHWAAAASVAMLIAAGLWWLCFKPDTTVQVADTHPVEEQIEQLPLPLAPVESETKLIAQTQPQTVKPPVHHVKKAVIKKKVSELDAEEEAAMQEIKAALALVSSKIRKGRQEAAKGAVHLESVDKIFKKKEG